MFSISGKEISVNERFDDFSVALELSITDQKAISVLKQKQQLLGDLPEGNEALESSDRFHIT